MASTSARRFSPHLEELEPRCLPSASDPTPIEQLMLEELNDIRASPAAYGVTVGLDLSAVAPSPPLAFDPRLVQAARLHSQDMNARGFFGHVNPDGMDVPGRLTTVQYPWTSWGESVAGSPAWSHPADVLAALIVENGVPDLDHRIQLLAMDSLHRGQTQVGIGIVEDGQGPLRNYYTIDTAGPADPRPCLCGVVFQDANGNGRYDVDEGLGGTLLDVAGVGTFTAFASGGYTIPLNPGTYTVTAQGGGLRQPITQTVTLGSDNVRLNFNGAATSPIPQLSTPPAASLPPAPASLPVPAAYLVRGDGALLHYTDPAGWMTIGAPGTIRSASTITETSGQVVAFAVSADQGLYRFDDRTGWARLGGAGSIVLASAGTDAAGRADAFVVTTGGAVCRFTATTGWSVIGAPGQVLSLAAGGSGRAFAVTADHSVFGYASPWGWMRYTQPGFATAVTAATEASGNVVLFAVTADGSLYRHDDPLGWTPVAAPGTVHSASSSIDRSGQAQAFALNSSGGLSEYRSGSDGHALGGPGGYVAVTPAGADVVFAMTAGGALFEHTDTSGWFSLIGSPFTTAS